ncbi:MMPL family transporter [Agromyces archimandritae]|uniref:MMPL family transporter n=1 Tax=Agromyces archimandritae TaxID=2781962 RepID=A0A975FQ99_9MICO|nr:MMPL family transporter [Agromyces archimandritae]QTX06014.1 MMPL family transporter [Agromyces archimandritae]
MAELLYRLGKFAAGRAWWVIGAWIVILAIAGGAFAIGFKGLATNLDVPGTASEEVLDELQQKLPDLAGASGTVVLHREDGEAFTPEQQERIAALVADAGSLPDVANVVDPFATEAERAGQAEELAGAADQLEAGRAQLDAGQEQLDAGLAQLEAGEAQLADAQAQLDAAREQAEAAGAPPEQLAALDAQQAELDAQKAAIQPQRDTLEEQQAELDAQRAELEDQAARAEEGGELLQLASGIRLVSDDGATALVSVAFTEPRMELAESSKQAVIDHFTAEPIDGVEVAFSTEISQGVPQILGVGEIVGVVFAAIVLLVMLGSLLAAMMPIVTAAVGVGVGVLASLAFSGIVQMASVTPILGVMLGLAVGIDYSLFIVNRHRTQLLHGAEVVESAGLANGTAGNAVVFAGSTVVVALLALNITGIPFLGVMGTVGAVCVLVAVLIAISLTPALLGLFKTHILSRRAQRRIGEVDHVDAKAKPMPWWRAIVTVLGTIVVLLIVAIPALSMRVGLPDGSAEATDSYAHRAHVLTEDAFGPGANGPLLVAAELPAGLDEADRQTAQLDVARTLAEQDDVVAVAPVAVSEDGELAAFQVIPAEGPSSASTEGLVRDLRALPPVNDEIELGVAGQAAINIDISANLADVLPVYLIVVVGLSLLIMILVFRSLLVPLIATGGFILSLFATYGAVVAVFQWGWLAAPLGIQTGPILSFLPVILVGILFGLAMDYQLFLASGMREAYVHGAKARLAVSLGFRAGRNVVIAAGLIMVSVFGGFVFAESTMIRSIGFGLAFGVLVDAFVVRMLLMPALMHMLGSAAWWIPKWLDHIMPNVDVEGAALERKHHAAPAVSVPAGGEST